jgi:hypothetical protein
VVKQARVGAAVSGKMSYRLVLLLLILLPAIACDPIYRFAGSVYSPALTPSTTVLGAARDESRPLSGVTVKLFERRRILFFPLSPALCNTMVSDENGKFETVFIGGARRGAFFLQLSKAGYQTREIDLSSDVQDSTLEISTCQNGWVCVEVRAVLSPEP